MKKVEDRIKKFIISYKDIFLDNFTDTGLFYEDIIRENYINNSEKFYNEIIDNIECYLKKEVILGYSIVKSNYFQFIFIAGNYRIFIIYSEDKNKKIRFIQEIKFNKK